MKQLLAGACVGALLYAASLAPLNPLLSGNPLLAMPITMGMYKPSGAVAPVTISTVAGVYIDTTVNPTHTITGGSIGAAHADRWIAVAYASRRGGASAGSATITVAGAAPDYVDTHHGLDIFCGIALFHVASGTTANIVFTANGACQGLAMQAYRFISTAADPRHVAALKPATAANPTGSLNVAEGGAVIAAVAGADNGVPSWSAGVTGTGSIDVDANDYSACARSGDLAVQTGRTITAGTVGSNRMLAISVKPS